MAQDAGSVQNRSVDLTGLGSLCLCEPSPAWSCQRNRPGCQPVPFRAKAAFPVQPLPVGLLDRPVADLQALGQFPLAHSLRPLHSYVLPLLLGQAGPSAGETALGPRLRLARDRALPDRVRPPLAEGEHHRKLELPGGRGRVEGFRQGPELHSRPVPPAGQPVSGSAKVDRASGRTVKFSCQPAPSVTPEEGGCRTRFWSAPERSMWMSHPGWGGSQTRVCDTGPQVTPLSLSRRGSQRHRSNKSRLEGEGERRPRPTAMSIPAAPESPSCRAATRKPNADSCWLLA